jgi:hypothetical protein
MTQAARLVFLPQYFALVMFLNRMPSMILFRPLWFCVE